MTLAPNTDTRPGRMLDILLRSENKKGHLSLTVAVADAEGKGKLHETFDIRKWTNGDKARLYVQIPRTADWDAEPRVYPASPITIDLVSGEITLAKDDPRVTPLIAYAARAALDYARTGQQPTPKNGTVTVQEAAICGACGIELKDDVSIGLGFGPDCEKRIFGTKTPRSKTMTSKAPKPEDGTCRVKLGASYGPRCKLDADHEGDHDFGAPKLEEAGEGQRTVEDDARDGIDIFGQEAAS